VSDALLSQLTLGEVQQELGGTITQRRSVIGWCEMFAKPGRWQQLRSFHVWFRCVSPSDSDVFLDLALKHSAFGQLGADKQLRTMTADTFARRAKRYGVGETSRDVRPGGQRCVILDRTFIDGLLDSGPPNPIGEPADFPRSEVGNSPVEGRSTPSETQPNGA
jgi:hypothetical protein